MKDLKEKVTRILNQYDGQPCIELYSDGSGAVLCEGEDVEVWDDWEEFEEFLNKER